MGQARLAWLGKADLVSGEDETAVVAAMREMYAAAQAKDRSRAEAVLAPGFHAFDLGGRFDGMALFDLIWDAMAAGRTFTWTVMDATVEVAGDLAWIAYVNRGAVGSGSASEPVTWLESAVLQREDRRWRIRFFHSTRAAGAPT